MRENYQHELFILKNTLANSLLMCFVGCSASSPGILKLFMDNSIVKRQRNREDVNPSTRTHQVVAVPVFGRFVSYIVYCWIYSCLISGKHYHDFPNHQHQSTTWPFVSHPPFLPLYSSQYCVQQFHALYPILIFYWSSAMFRLPARTFVGRS